MRPRDLVVLLGFVLLAFVLAGCPLGSRHGADAQTSIRGATEAADLPNDDAFYGGMPQTTEGEGGAHTRNPLKSETVDGH